MTIKQYIYGIFALTLMLPLASTAAVSTSCGKDDNGHPHYTCSGSSFGCNRFYKTVLVLGGKKHSNTSLSYFGDYTTSDAVVEVNGRAYELAKYDVHFKQHKGKQYILVMDGKKTIEKVKAKWSDAYISGEKIRGGRMSYRDFLNVHETVPVDVLRVLDSK